MATATRGTLAASIILTVALGCTAGPDGRGYARTSAAAAAQPDGLYGVTPDGLFVYVDPATARVRVIGEVSLPTSPAGADFSCDGTFYALAGADGGMLLYTVDLATGWGDPLEFYRGDYQGAGFEFGLDEETPYWRDGSAFYRLDRAAATASQVATLAGSGVSLTVPATCDGFLSGTTVTFGDAKGSQAIAYYKSGRIVISPTHTASLSRILNHEVWHIIDYRDNGVIDWGENVPPK